MPFVGCTAPGVADIVAAGQLPFEHHRCSMRSCRRSGTAPAPRVSRRTAARRHWPHRRPSPLTSCHRLPAGIVPTRAVSRRCRPLHNGLVVISSVVSTVTQVCPGPVVPALAARGNCNPAMGAVPPSRQLVGPDPLPHHHHHHHHGHTRPAARSSQPARTFRRRRDPQPLTVAPSSPTPHGRHRVRSLHTGRAAPHRLPSVAPPTALWGSSQRDAVSHQRRAQRRARRRLVQQSMSN